MTSPRIELHAVNGNDAQGNAVFAYLATYPALFRRMKISSVVRRTELSRFGVVILAGKGHSSPDTDKEAERIFMRHRK